MALGVPPKNGESARLTNLLPLFVAVHERPCCTLAMNHVPLCWNVAKLVGPRTRYTGQLAVIEKCRGIGASTHLEASASQYHSLGEHRLDPTLSAVLRGSFRPVSSIHQTLSQRRGNKTVCWVADVYEDLIRAIRADHKERGKWPSASRRISLLVRTSISNVLFYMGLKIVHGSCLEDVFIIPSPSAAVRVDYSRIAVAIYVASYLVVTDHCTTSSTLDNI